MRAGLYPAMWAAIQAAVAAHRICDTCRWDVRYIPPACTGPRGWDCVDEEEKT